MKKDKIIISILLILVVTFVTFSPAFTNGFTNWDDDIYVTKNIMIKDLSLRNLQKIFTSFILGNYHPLTLLSFAIEYNFFKLEARVYHTTNIILHMLNCLLVFCLILMLTHKLSIALITALLFGVHPLRVDTAAWISGRKDLLYSLFFLGVLISYLYYRKKESLKYYFLSLFLFVLSLLSKAMAITLPVVLLLFDYYFRRKINKNSLKEKVPFFVIALVFGIIAIFARQAYQEVLQEHYLSFLGKVFINIHRLVFYYMMRIVAPITLSHLKPYFVSNLNQSFTIFLCVSILIMVILIAGVIISVKHTRKIFFASLFFLITIFPTLLISNVGFSADRFTYVPTISIFYIVTVGFVLSYEKKVKYSRVFKSLLLIILIWIIGTLSYLTWQRCQVWADSVTLNEEFVKNFPNDPRTYINRGAGYNEKREYDMAIADFTQALKIEPNYAEAFYDRGNVYCNKGNYAKAIADYNQALRINPNFVEAYQNRGDAYKDIRDYDRAIADYTEVLRIKPNYAEVYHSRGNLYYEIGAYDLAIADYTQTLKLDPNYVEVYNNRGNAYGLKGEYDRAIADFSQAIRIDPGIAETHYNRGNSYVFKGEYNRAIADFTQALRINPDFVQAYNNRARSYFIKKQYDRAWADVRKMYGLGVQVDSEFLKLLRRDSGME